MNSREFFHTLQLCPQSTTGPCSLVNFRCKPELPSEPDKSDAHHFIKARLRESTQHKSETVRLIGVPNLMLNETVGFLHI